MIRRATWQADLVAYLSDARTKPFAWGEHDCAMFAAGAVIAMTGTDPIPAFRGAYESELGAAKALVKIGNGKLDATLDNLFEPISASFARRGDLVWHDRCVGVAMSGYALFVGQEGSVEGLVRVPRRDWEKGWRVG